MARANIASFQAELVRKSGFGKLEGQGMADAIAAMRLDGLLVDSILADGGWHRCQVESDKRNTDGSYKAIVTNFGPLVFWSNWKHGLQGWYCSKSRQPMSRKERQEFEAEIARIAEEDRKRREAAQAEAAKRAAYIWDKAKTPVNRSHGYLARKDIVPGPCRETADGRLVLPLYDSKGELATLQFIAAEKRDGHPDKLLLKDGKKQGCYCPLPELSWNEDKPLLIAEGFATAMSLHTATGYEVWVAIDCHNLLEVAKLARARYPERLIVICADYDEPLLPNYPGKGGIGAEKGRKAAEAIGAYFCLCPVWEGRSKADFNDLASDLGLERIRQEIEAALQGRPVTDCIIASEFLLKPNGPEAGLYWIQTLPGGIQKEIRLGDPLQILGYTRTGDGDNWGLLLKWLDRDGREHQLALPKSLLTGQKSDWLPLLADGGWNCISEYRKQIGRYLETAKPVKRIRCVTSIGWSGDRYVLPDCIYGAGEDQIVLQAQGYNELYQSKGNLEDWQELAKLCVGNPKLGFALACAFAGPLLKLAEMGGGIFHLLGRSSCGKSTALIAAASVWGKPEFQFRKWKTTDNALEVTASLHNDGLLILDELGEVKARILGETVYMLSGGQGKNRAGKDGGLRKSYRWRVLTLSSGEVGLADKLLEDGKRSRAGQETRFMEIPVTTADIANLHGIEDSGLLIRKVKRLAETHYGVAGRAYLEMLTQEETLQSAKANLRDGLDGIADSFCPEDCDGQVRRAALLFAMVSIAGTLAREFGILPADFEAEDYARKCFKEWLEQRGGSGPAEEMAILRQARLFIEQHGQSRFQNIKDPDAPCQNRAGYREDSTYYCLPEAFKAEIVKGHSVTRAVEALAKAGWLKTDGGRNTRVIRVPNLGTLRTYKLELPEEE